MMKPFTIKMRLVLCLGILLSLSCAKAGHKVTRIKFQDMVPQLSYRGDGPVAVATHDKREYIVSGQSKPTYIGQVRALVIPEPVHQTTWDGVSPMAGEMNKAIVHGLANQGFQAQAVALLPTAHPEQVKESLLASSPQRAVLLEINEWMFDGINNLQLVYDIQLKVLNKDGALLARVPAKGKRTYGTEVNVASNDIKEFYRTVLKRLLSNPKVAAAMTGEAAPLAEQAAEAREAAGADEGAPPPLPGAAAAPGAKSIKHRLSELDQLRKEGLISNKDYERKKKEILDSL